jgi:hypothetical protein
MLESNTNQMVHSSDVPMTTVDNAALSDLFQQLLEAYDDLGLEGFSEADFAALKASDVQLPAPSSKL